MKSIFIKFVIFITIFFVVLVFVGLFSSLIVNHFILNTRLANFTIYDGYADFNILLAYLLLSALLVFDKIKGNAWLMALGSLMAFVIIKAFVIDVIAHYFRFYVKTNQNGPYSFEIFKGKLASQWNSLLFEFSNLGQVLSFSVWVFMALLGICYLSLLCKNWLRKRELTY
jgi:hypothetical protein